MAEADGIDLLGGAERLIKRAGFAVDKGVAAVDLHLAGLTLDGGELSEADEVSLRAVSEQLQGMVLGALATLQEMHAVAPDVVAMPVLPTAATEQLALPAGSEPTPADTADDGDANNQSNGSTPDNDPPAGAAEPAAPSDTPVGRRRRTTSSSTSAEATDNAAGAAQDQDISLAEGIPPNIRKKQIDMLTAIFGEDRFDAIRQMGQEEMLVFADLMGNIYSQMELSAKAQKKQDERSAQLREFISGMPMSEMERKYHVGGIKIGLDGAVRNIKAVYSEDVLGKFFDDTRAEFQKAFEASI